MRQAGGGAALERAAQHVDAFQPAVGILDRDLDVSLTLCVRALRGKCTARRCTILTAYDSESAKSPNPPWMVCCTQSLINWAWLVAKKCSLKVSFLWAQRCLPICWVSEFDRHPIARNSRPIRRQAAGHAWQNDSRILVRSARVIRVTLSLRARIAGRVAACERTRAAWPLRR